MHKSIVLLAFASLLSACGGEDDPKPRYAVLARGEMAGADTAARKALHDEIASSTGAQSRDLGDIAHRVYIAVTDSRQFAALDLWVDRDGLDSFYSDPAVQSAFGGFFAAPPDLGIYVERRDFVSWGDAWSSGPGVYAVVIRGTLAAESTEESRVYHNQVAEEGREVAQSLGDIAHLAYLDEDEPREILIIDYWTSFEGLNTFFSDPDVQQAFAGLFAAPPVVTIYSGTDWYQW